MWDIAEMSGGNSISVRQGNIYMQETTHVSEVVSMFVLRLNAPSHPPSFCYTPKAEFYSLMALRTGDFQSTLGGKQPVAEQPIVVIEMTYFEPPLDFDGAGKSPASPGRLSQVVGASDLKGK